MDNNQEPTEPGKTLPESNELERPAATVESTPVLGGGKGVVDATGGGSLSATPGEAEPAPSSENRLTKKFRNLKSIYLLAFFILIVAAISVVIVSLQWSSNNQIGKSDKSTPQSLSDEQLAALEGSTTTIGDPKQILNVASNAVFAGKVLIRGSLDVAGTIKVGGSLSLPGITVSGNSSFDQVQINSLSISGNTAIAGQLSIQQSLSVSGTARLGGSLSAAKLNVDNLQISKDLTLSHHLVVSGGSPSKTNGSALGSGGTASVSGSDTGGTVTINTGGSPPAGCFLTLTFTQKFSSTPHVLVSPVNSSAAGLSYYASRSTTSFSICATNPAGSNTYIFDYFITG